MKEGFVDRYDDVRWWRDATDCSDALGDCAADIEVGDDESAALEHELGR